MDIILKITQQTCAVTKAYNERLQLHQPELNMKTGLHMLSGFSWPSWSEMPDKVKNIHILRAKLLYFSNCFQPSPDKIHDFFIKARKAAGWILEDTRKDWDSQCNWIGHDPFLKPFFDCSAGFQAWCVARNLIAKKATAQYL